MQNYEKNGNLAKGLQNFQFEGKEVRVVVEENNVLLFVAVDVCNVLGYKNVSDVLGRLGDGVVSNYPIPDKKGRNQPTNLLTEQGLDSLISGSKKAEASRFDEWVKETFYQKRLKIISEIADFQVFIFGNEFFIRAWLDENANIWFIASDICKVLNISNVSDAVSRLDEDEKSDLVLTDIAGRPNKAIIIDESGLYSLVLSSRKPEAKAFKKWVTKKVLPAIRKTGKYEMPKQVDEHFDEEENALTLEGAALKLNYEVAVATRFIKVINDLLDDRLHSFKNFELREIMAQLKAGQQNMEKRLMGYIEDIINVIGKEKLNKDVPTPIVSYVYLMKRLDAPTLEDGLIMAKVGKSNNPDIRKFELEAGGAELSVIGRIGFPNEELAYVWEQTIKKTFEPHHYKREWYLLGEAQIDFFLGVGRLISILYGL